MRSALSVVIADDERPARLSLANLLGECGDVRIVGEAQNRAEAVQLADFVRNSRSLERGCAAIPAFTPG